MLAILELRPFISDISDCICTSSYVVLMKSESTCAAYMYVFILLCVLRYEGILCA